MIELSDHVRARRDRARERFLEVRFRHDLATTDARQALLKRRLTRRARPFWDRLTVPETPDERRLRRRAKRARRQAESLAGQAAELAGDADRWEAGLEGVEAMVSALAVLPDSYRSIRGFRNDRGEVDVVLVGPTGVWALVVKNRRIRLCADGERWWFERLDPRGNGIGVEWAVDTTGRTWGRRAADVGHELERWLSRHGVGVPVSAAVVVVHPGAGIALSRGSLVDLVSADPRAVVTAVRDAPTVAGPSEVERILDLVAAQHRSPSIDDNPVEDADEARRAAAGADGPAASASPSGDGTADTVPGPVGPGSVPGGSG